MLLSWLLINSSTTKFFLTKQCHLSALYFLEFTVAFWQEKVIYTNHNPGLKTSSLYQGTTTHVIFWLPYWR